MIDWNDNAKAAVKAYDEWLDEPDNGSSGKPLKEFLSEIPCPTQKTVADAVEQESEKWTHTIKSTKEKCRITEGPNKAGQVFIKTEDGLWDCLYIEQLKPIKPTIDESQAWVKMQSLIPKHGVTAAYQMTIQQYDII